VSFHFEPATARSAFASLTARRVGILVVFCVIYGSILGIAGGAPQSVADLAGGIVTSLILFVPAFVATVATAAFASARPVRRAVQLAVAAAVGLGMGYLIAGALDDPLTRALGSPQLRHVTSPLPVFAICMWGLAVFLGQERSEAARRALEDQARHETDLRRETAQAELLLLQSQIEPHFLFNSLAHVRRLHYKDPAAGRAMLRDLTKYLGAMLPATHERGIAFDRDLDLALAYVNVQRIRMGPRLVFEVDVPSEARQALVPPMLTTTLVENSIKHGLSPLPEGGTIRISARVTGHAVEIRISDTGRGFQSSLGAGVGLANTRARLAILHGENASLALTQNVPRGVTASVVVPLAVEAS
jgi:Histidine kinase